MITPLLIAALALGEWGSPEGRKLVAGDLGTVRLVKSNERVVVLEVYFPRQWTSATIKAGTKLIVKEVLVLADAEGVFYRGPAPTFVARQECENDGGGWIEPVARLELSTDKLIRSKAKPIGSEHTVGIAVLGNGHHKPLTKEPDARTLMRVDFDLDGQPDAELRSAPADAGCGPDLKEEDLRLASVSGSFRARCCGP
jgi:hypothetical protein